MNSTAIEIAKKLNGRVEGNGQVELNKISKIDEARKGSISFLANPKYMSFLKNTRASAVLISNEFKAETSSETTFIRVKDPYIAFTKLLTEFAQDKEKKTYGIHPTSSIHPSTSIHENVYIGPNVTIGESTIIKKGVVINANAVIGSNVVIGQNTKIFSGVIILDQTRIGDDCVIQSGAIIGSEGFGFNKNEDGKYIKTPQLGKVVIKDNVEIGANTTIDRATLGSTIIGHGVKLDNLIQIAHNVEIGSDTVIAAQTGIAGSSKIGARCKIGGQVGIIGHLRIGDDVQIQGQTGVINDVANKDIIQGTPAIDFRSFYKSYSIFKNLPNFESRIRELEKKIKK